MDTESLGLGVSSYVAFHLCVLGLLSWMTGQRFLLPSLGPSAFALATLPEREIHLPRRIIGGQFIAAIAAFVAARLLLVHGVTTSPDPFSLIILRQVITTFVAVILTTVGMYATNTQHPPAYATTLIISLGLLVTLRGLIVFLLAILVMVSTHELVGKYLDIWHLPYEYEKR